MRKLGSCLCLVASEGMVFFFNTIFTILSIETLFTGLLHQEVYHQTPTDKLIFTLYLCCFSCANLLFKLSIMSNEDIVNEHSPPHDTNNVSVPHKESESQLISVLSAMQVSMAQTNTYLKMIFQERRSVPKHGYHVAAGSVEGRGDEESAPK
jgi:hypothetical protein